MRRVTVAASAILLVLLSLVAAEAALLVLLLVFSSVLRLNFGIQLGDQVLQMFAPVIAEPTVVIHRAGIVGSILFTFAVGALAAMWRHRRWTPA